MERPTSDQEIDLLKLLAKFYRVLKGNKILTVLCPVLGLGIGLVFSGFSKESVKASTMIVTDLISENESKFLAEQLEKADTIQGLKSDEYVLVRNISYEVKKGEQSDKNIYLEFTVVIKDKKVLPRLQTVIVDYLNQSEPIMRHRIEKEKFYTEMIKKIDIELIALGEVKDQIDNKTKATFLLPSDLFAKTVELFDKKVTYQVSLDEIKSVHVVKAFGSLTKSTKWSKPVYAIVGFLTGLAVLFMILFIKFFNQYYTEFERAKKN